MSNDPTPDDARRVEDYAYAAADAVDELASALDEADAQYVYAYAAKHCRFMAEKLEAK